MDLTKIDPKKVISVLIADDDEDGYEADPVKAGEVVKSFFATFTEEVGADDIAEFLYTWCRL